MGRTSLGETERDPTPTVSPIRGENTFYLVW